MKAGSNQNISRRNLIKAAAGLGAGAAVGLPALVFLTKGDAQPGVGSEASAAAFGDRADTQFDQPLVAYVRDAAAGEVVVMFGARETVITDRELVTRLVGAARA
jgi:TAT (twin-arginine translocation) pathway-exported protein